MNQPRKIRWLIAHQPQELFVRTARAFSEELNKYCAGDLEIEILTYSDYVEKYNEIAGLENMKHRGDDEETFEAGISAFWNALFESQIEMSQMQVVRVADHHYDFNALDLPFLFEDHDHVQRVVEGPIGQKLCAELGRKSGVTGLAFTYSGGYRVIGSHEPICTLAELKQQEKNSNKEENNKNKKSKFKIRPLVKVEKFRLVPHTPADTEKVKLIPNSPVKTEKVRLIPKGEEK